MECGQTFREVIVLGLMMIICCPHMSHSQEIRIVNTPSSIKALLGQNLTIPCLVTRNDNQKLDLDLSIVSVSWTKKSSDGDEHDVYQYSGHGDEQIRPGSLIEENALRRGNASLTLHRVQRSDEGEYTCTVFITPYKTATRVNVHLLAQPEVTLSSSELIVEPEREKSLTCEVTRFYPEAVKIRWVKYMKGADTRSSLDKATCLSVPEENSDGTFNVTSLLTVRPSSLEEDGDVYSCVVTHAFFSQNKTINFTLTVKEPPTSIQLTSIIIIILSLAMVMILVVALSLCFMNLPPKISDIAGIDDLVHGKSSNLSWMVLGFRPRNIEIHAYLERGDQRREIRSWEYPSPKALNDHAESHGEGFGFLMQENRINPLTPERSIFSYYCLCSMSIIPDKTNDKEAELVIEIKHASLKTALTERKELNIKGDLFTAHIMGPQCIKHGEEVTLTCEITKCDPEPLSITWLKEKQIIYNDGEIRDTRYSHTETRDEPHEGNVLRSSSSLNFTAKVKEDHGVKYTCKITYSAIEETLRPYLEVFVTAQPVVEQITSKYVNQQMELSCRVHSFHPRTIVINWFKEEEELPTTDSELSTEEDGLYSTTSILMYIPEMEDIGKTFMCQVDHQSLPDPETREWKLEKQ